MKKNTVFLLLGSNIGDRGQMLQDAILKIGEGVGKLILKSLIYETEPWGVSNQPNYLNQVIQIETTLLPTELLEATLKIEKALGRERREYWGVRTIDIDILYYDTQIIEIPSLIIPHPRLHERRFTLIPLAEIAPNFIHPKLRESNKEILENCLDQNKVTTFKF